MILALLALLVTAVPPARLTIDDPDLRCMVAVSFALGMASEKRSDADTIGGMNTVFMYFLGKVDARYPGDDLARAFSHVIGRRGYEAQLPGDLVRCGAEAEARGAALMELGEQLKRIGPLAPSGAG